MSGNGYRPGLRVHLTRPRGKYSAEPQIIDGIRFDSKREARRYGELVLLMKARRIRALTIHPIFPLLAADCSEAYRPPLGTLLRPFGGTEADGSPVTVATSLHCVASYEADFMYEEIDAARQSWTPVVEDAKGVRTQVYRLKRRWFERQYGIGIREV